jgi:hypothetical protein
MNDRGDMASFESTLSDMFRRMGLPEPGVSAKVFDDWDGVAGDPWAGRSKPLVIQGTTLVVEVSTPSQVAFLKYAVSDLLETLESRVGKGIIEHIEVRPPPR